MTNRFALIGFILLSVWTFPASADVLFEQISVPIGNPASSPISVFSTITDAELEQAQAWDNFSLSQSASVSGLTWKGAFNDVFNPDDSFRGENDFQIRIYPDASGAPDLTSTVFSADLDGGTAGLNDGADVRKAIVADEKQSRGGIVTNYEADLSSFDLAPGDYWLSIQAIQTLPSPIEDYDDPKWGWVFSSNEPKGLFSYDEAFGDTVKPGIKFNLNATFALLGSFTGGLFGDFDLSGVLDLPDIDMLASAVRNGDTDSKWDVDQNGSVTEADHTFWISDLKKTLPGDANFDFKVGFDDFLKLSGAFGKEGGWGDGNFDTNTDVNFADFLKLSANFGKSVATAASEPVPEPASGLLCGFAVMFFGLLRRRREHLSL